MSDDSVALGRQALETGRWAEARRVFESVLLADDDNPEAHFGLATALWWLGDSRAGVGEASRAYALFRTVGDGPAAIECAVWLSYIVHGDFANHAAANGWVGRAETLLQGSDDGRLHGWVHVARAALMTDLSAAEKLTEQALSLARNCGDVDLELTALAQLGRIRIGAGENTGFALIDEAMAAALAGERNSLDTVANAACDMLTACELAQDLERAEQWSRITDDFVARFGCPYLYAECRIFYGSVLVAKGHWAAAEQELIKGIRVTDGVSPGLHARARTRLAALRTRQGRLEEAEALLEAIQPDTESEIEATLAEAALQLARHDPQSARRTLERVRQRITGHRLHIGTTLGMLVEALLALDDRAGAGGVAAELLAYAAGGGGPVLRACAAVAAGRVAASTGDSETAVAQLRTALAVWSRLHQPFESARTLAALGHVLASMDDPAATSFLRHALESFQELGATLEADRVAHQLRALGIPVRPARAASGTLSDREQQVARLVAAGLSNPEIAARLYVSPKTVSHHVSHILAKLDLRNRAEIAAHTAAAQEDGRLPRAAE